MSGVEDYIAHLLACGRAEATLKTNRSILSQFAAEVGSLAFAEAEQVEGYLARPGIKQITRLSRYFALRAFFRWLEHNGRLLVNPMDKVLEPRVPRVLPEKIMSRRETEKVLEVYPSDTKDILSYRNRVILELMYSCSLRRGEAVGLNVGDFDPDTRSLKVTKTKTRQGRFIPVGRTAAELLSVYMRDVRPVFGVVSDAMFLSMKKRRLSTNKVTELARFARFKAGIRTPATSHSFRKSSCTHMIRNHAPLEAVAALLGIRNFANLEHYAKMYPRDVEAMLRSHHPRWKEKSPSLPKLRPSWMYPGKKF